MMEVINIRSHGWHSHSTHLTSAEVGWSYDRELGQFPANQQFVHWKIDGRKMSTLIGLILDPFLIYT